MLLEARDLRKRYDAGPTSVEALAGVTLDVAPGEFVAIMGPSGCGKSTLLHLCGGMDRPTSGQVVLDGIGLAGQSDDFLTRMRRERIGFVFQFFNLLPTLTVAENIALPLMLSGTSAADARPKVEKLADRVGLRSRTEHYPQQLSGGEMQRAAIARAIVHGPRLLVADEPTGNLDSVNGERVLALLAELNAEASLSILLATHAPEVASAAHRLVTMRDGRVSGEQRLRPLHGTAGVPV